MIVKKIKPETQEEFKQVSTTDGKLERIKMFGECDLLVGTFLHLQRDNFLSDKDFLIILLYEALIQKEKIFGQLLNLASNSVRSAR